MERDHLKFLRRWRHDLIRVPLLIKGARQVGKSWIVNHFGMEFSSYIEINFEKDKRVHALFPDTVSLERTLEQLSAYTQTPIKKGETLLFLDEIQECPNALRALRYFKEEVPDLHVIAAGSLLEFALEKLGVAVGRVDYLHLFPLSFLEFLSALGLQHLRKMVEATEVDPASHEILIEHLKNYMWLGGMPAVVDTWLNHKDAALCQRVQDRILYNYLDDIQKYAKRHQIEHVENVFRSIPTQIGKKFKYAHVDRDSKTHPIKQGLQLLLRAGVAYPCFHTSAQSYPLGSEVNERRFKAFFFDIGIAQRLLGLDLAEWITNPLEISYLGPIAEQLVAQELVAYTAPGQTPSLYYWLNESSSGNAEVDFVAIHHQSIIPVEVKSGVKGGMKSLRVFLDKHPHSPFGLKLSLGLFAKQDHLEEVPLYGIAGWLQN